MIVKSFMFLSCLLGIVGCGVMSDPASKEDTAKVAEIAGGTLMLDDGNISFVFSSQDDVIMTSTTYKVFEKREETKAFLTDINSTAQTLAYEERLNIESWITRIDKAQINYHDNNLLFYPLFQSQNCGIKEDIKIENNSTTITIEAINTVCDETPVYYMLVYRIDKEIENISIKAFGEDIVTFPNKISK